MKYLLVPVTLLGTAYLASSFLLPVFIALFFSMSVSPISSVFERFRFPKSLSSLITVILVLGFLTGILLLVVEPMNKWIDKFPTTSEEISNHLSELSKPLDELAGGEANSLSDKVVGKAASAFFEVIASSTPVLFAQIFAIIILSYFFLCYGEDILRRTVTIRETFSEKRVTVSIARSIQTEISHYLLVILCINTALGVSVTCVFYLFGIDDPLLWGFAAAVLNFAPYIGPCIMFVTLLLVGYLEFDSTFQILLPGLIYLFINIIEANFVTPTALGRRLKLNPLIVLVWLFLWGWIWGAAGTLLGVPMLVCFKIIAQRLELFGDWIHLIEEPKNELITSETENNTEEKAEVDDIGLESKATETDLKDNALQNTQTPEQSGSPL